ncbi:MAG TPA: class D sortase [Gaiellaceae bacterium]|nr:class D sortase [Gaiellaceae bacterium]
MRLRRATRLLGTLLVVAGVLTLAWAVVVWRWQDPFTALYTHFQQEHLAHVYSKHAAAFVAAQPPPIVRRPTRNPARELAAAEKQIALEAARYRRSLRAGDPVGRMKIGRIGLNMIVVQGTDEASLEKGPGHYIGTALPGQGRLIYVAGHRTTFLAPFSHIDSIRNGDYVTFELPYATFTYRAFRHYVVPADDLSVLVNHGREILRLQACHPRFFATHRYIVDARLVAFTPHGQTHTYTLTNPR